MMKSRQFILNFLDGKIQRKQPIGVIAVKNDYPQSFASGNFARGIFPSGKYSLGLELENKSCYVPSKDEINNYFRKWEVDDENETIFTDKKGFEETMQKLMVPIVKKNNFPLFVRDLSRLGYDW